MARKTPTTSTGKNVKPTTIGRPILVGGPVVQPGASESTVGVSEPVLITAPLVKRTVKIIQPLSDEIQSAGAETTEASPHQVAVSDVPVTITSALKPPGSDIVKPADVSSARATKKFPETQSADTDPTIVTEQADLDKQAAAAEARHHELEALIRSGTYAVPINAVQRKRSRLIIGGGLILVLIIALGIVDVLADMGTIHLPTEVPHTDLFAGN